MILEYIPFTIDFIPFVVLYFDPHVGGYNLYVCILQQICIWKIYHFQIVSQ
jgi:hypothetical protein